MEEPARKSMLDRISTTKRFSVCRFLFCARISQPAEEITKIFGSVFNQNTTEPQLITGLLLVFPDYIFHVIESSEDVIFQFFRDFLQNHSTSLGDSKCFPIQIEVRNRFFDKCYSKKAKLNDDENNFGPINPDCNFETVANTYKETIVNLYLLYHELRMTRLKSHVNFLEKLEELYEVGHPRLPRRSSVVFILKNQWGDNLQVVTNNYWNPECPSESEDVWPFPVPTLQDGKT